MQRICILKRKFLELHIINDSLAKRYLHIHGFDMHLIIIEIIKTNLLKIMFNLMFRAIIYKQSSTFNFIQFLCVQSIEGTR